MITIQRNCKLTILCYANFLQKNVSVGVEYEVEFLRKSYWGGFTFPNVADICNIAKSDVVLKLPSPQTSEKTSRAGRQLSFSIDLTAYKKLLC